MSFLQAASPKALKAIRQTIRGWSFQTRSGKNLPVWLVPDVQSVTSKAGSTITATSIGSELYPTLWRVKYFAIVVSGRARRFKRLRHIGRGARGTGWLRVIELIANACSLTRGKAFVRTRPLRKEPYEPRGSRTVLGARRGETPPRDSLTGLHQRSAIYAREGVELEQLKALADWVGGTSRVTRAAGWKRSSTRDERDEACTPMTRRFRCWRLGNGKDKNGPAVDLRSRR